MAKYIPAWQRVVLTVLQSVPNATSGQSAWNSLQQEEREAVTAFATERCKGDQEKARLQLEKTLPLARFQQTLPLWLIILLGVFGAAAAATMVLALPHPWAFRLLALVGVMVLVCLLQNAKANRMARQWKNREGSREGAFKALKSMFSTALHSSVQAVNKLHAVLALVMVVLFGALACVPERGPAQERLLAEKVKEVTAGKAVMADALALLPEGYDGIETIQQAMKYTAHGSDEEFLLAALMWMHIEADGTLMLSDYATGTAGQPMYEVLENTDPAQIDNPEEIAALAVLLKYAGEHQEMAFTRFLAEKNLPAEVLSAFGTAMKAGRTEQELLLLCDTIRAAGHDPQPFLLAALPDLDYARAAELIASAGDDEQRRQLILAAAPALTDLDEVLAFIRLAKEYGVSAAECYPDGALLTWDTTRYDPYTSSEAAKLGKRDTFLIIRRTEKKEPFTSVAVPAEEQTAYDEALPAELYRDYDPDAETGATQYTVVLETAVLDSMPAERIPTSLAECDAVVILDSWYWCDGYVRSSRSTSMYQASKKHQVDILTYGMAQLIAVYNVESGEILFFGKENAAYSPAMMKGEDRMSMEEWALEENYIAALDEKWMDDAYDDFLFSLIRRNWQLVP